MAKEAIAGKCGYWQVDSVSARTKAEVGAKIRAAEFCDIAKSKRGVSKSKASGGTFTLTGCDASSC